MSVWYALPLALVALASGPLLGRRLSRWPHGLKLLDGFVLSAVAGIVAIEVVPPAIAGGSLTLPLLALVGFIIPALAERAVLASSSRAHRWVLSLALIGLAAHSILDGVALAEGARSEGSVLGLGVILHQVPVGLMVWAVLRHRSAQAYWLVLSMMATMTVTGAVSAAGLLELLGRDGTSALDAIIGGSLLHVVMHRNEPWQPNGPAPSAIWESGGAAAGVAFLALVTALTSHHAAHAIPLPAVSAFMQRLVTLAADSAPALLLAYAVSGVISVATPGWSIAWLRRGGPVQQATRGMLLGLPLPICSCGVVPLYQSLIRRGAPPTAALALLVAAPELGADAFLISLPLLGTEYALLRLIAAALVALSVALLIGRRLPTRLPTMAPHASSIATDGWSRLRQAARAGFGDMLDHTAPWILVGLMIAAAITPRVLNTLSITRLPPVLDVIVFAVLGIPTFVCASAATPLVAVLVAGGVSPGAGLAFLLSGPATNLSTIAILSRLHGRFIGVLFASAVGAAAVVAGVIANQLLRGWTPLPIGTESAHPTSTLQLVALGSLGGLTLWSFLRRGPRAFFAELALAVSSEHHSHDHHHASPTAHRHEHVPAPANDVTGEVTPALPSPASSR
jgi:uncharacterized membrane protein YraQ (UPF0718 family)